jgi:hypothetical protein
MEVRETSGGERRSSDDDDVRVELATTELPSDVTLPIDVALVTATVTSCDAEQCDEITLLKFNYHISGGFVLRCKHL